MFNRPALTDIVARTRGDLLTRLTQDELLRRADAEINTRVLAGASHEIHGYLDWISLQIIYDTADDELLVRWASIWKVERKDAQFASGNVLVTGTAGQTIEAGSVLKRPDGALFDVTADTVLGASATAVPVLAEVAGVAGNTDAGMQLTFLNPIANVQSVVVVDSNKLANGSDIESIPDLRARFIERIQNPPSGGAADDYVEWAKEVPGVTRAWVYPKEMGAGTVTVRFVRDDDPTIIPDPTEVAAVKSYIDSKRPVTADLYVVAPTPVTLNFNIQLTPSTVAVKGAVEASLRDLLLREAAPGVTLLISHIREAISTAAGETDNVLISPTTNQVYTTGQMPVFGAISWV
ncbi:baseplate J/gp47 family protein [Paraburkholderia terrae]|uniref:baseplate J/gp47 family protein n=1 Tax=Paraburkholderia terrae TaxID=311230 RepID=UPI001EE214DC|nr:baseplate J/gp47 family protein [Paraburkholderia terrae]GJH05043.1 baseplate J/gp47 family protein [Paraburkholderia terrae]